MLSVSYRGRMWSVVGVSNKTLTLALSTDKSVKLKVALSKLSQEVQNFYNK